jgi:hypothetical protein
MSIQLKGIKPCREKNEALCFVETLARFANKIIGGRKTQVQGCQMAYFQTNTPNWGKLWWVLQWKDVYTFYGHLVYCTAIWYTLWPFGIFYVIWYI